MGGNGLISRTIRSRAFVPAVLALAGALRLGWILAVDARPIDDFLWYFDRAVGIARGEGVVFAGEPTARWPVGYPALLAVLFLVTGPSLLAAKLLNVVLAVATLELSRRIGARLSGSETAGRLALVLLALHPNAIAYSSLTATEIPFVFLMLLGVWLLIERRERLWAALAAGAVFGVGCLVKPIMLFVPLVLAAASFVAGRRRLIAPLVATYAVLALTLTPWIARNYRVFGDLVLVSNNGGINLLIGNHEGAGGGYARELPPEIARRLESVRGERERDDLARALALEHLSDAPWQALQRLPLKVWHLYHKDVEGLYWNELALGVDEDRPPSERPFYALKLVAQLYWIALLGLFAAGSLRLLLQGPPREADPLWPLGLWMIGYFTVITVVAFGSSRLHFPIVPWIAVHAAAGWAALRRPWRLLARVRQEAFQTSEPLAPARQHGLSNLPD